MEYRELFQIEIIHPYFSDIPKDIIVVAENNTKKHLKALGYILKKTANGIQVLAPFHKENGGFQSLGDDDIFTFYAYPTSKYIQEITDFSNIEKGNMISFSNDDNSQLISSQTTQKGVFDGFSAIANIVILGNKINTNITDQSTKFQAEFRSKSIKWRYYFVSNSKDSDIRLESRDEQIRFNEISTDQNILDSVINSLQLNFPNSQIRVFESRDEIPYSSKPKKNIKLLQNENVLISNLPNPRRQQQGIQIIKIK